MKFKCVFKTYVLQNLFRYLSKLVLFNFIKGGVGGGSAIIYTCTELSLFSLFLLFARILCQSPKEIRAVTLADFICLQCDNHVLLEQFITEYVSNFNQYLYLLTAINLNVNVV